jgi:uncharacterized protein YecT (DUF1311 family)
MCLAAIAAAYPLAVAPQQAKTVLSSAGPGPVPKPPVIPEQFKPPFDCNHSSNLGVIGCALRQLYGADARVDAEIKLLYGLVYDNVSRRDLVSAQRAWLSYRKADCISQADMYQGGSQQPIAYWQCLAVDDQSRSTDLRGFFDALTEGRAHKPEFP